MTPAQKAIVFCTIFLIFAVPILPTVIAAIFWNSYNATSVGICITVGLIALLLLFGAITRGMHDYKLYKQEQKEQATNRN